MAQQARPKLAPQELDARAHLTTPFEGPGEEVVVEVFEAHLLRCLPCRYGNCGSAGRACPGACPGASAGAGMGAGGGGAGPARPGARWR